MSIVFDRVMLGRLSLQKCTFDVCIDIFCVSYIWVLINFVDLFRERFHINYMRRDLKWRSLVVLRWRYEAHSEHRFPAPKFLQTLPDLVTPLKGNSLSPRSCPPTRSAPSERFGYWSNSKHWRKVPESDALSVGTDKTVEATQRPSTHVNMRHIHPG